MSIAFSEYIVERLKQCQVKYVFGVPGDFNLELVSLASTTLQLVLKIARLH